ncbi:CRISPR-associated helicase/endonuclease Cas3 [Liquorilactobacillus aquaticus]|uniref:CRISPR-associated helicase/endonuclease Cas3 n=1 Tax=Liquorilactobacillus aquaticus TaxID=392566 RepID=UPI00071053C4|nr:CRISPR-associated helicase/endonuclease Cas3 [Liquorilactobacillus aquaticus]
MSLSRQVTTLWAKKRSQEGEHYWLPLITHLLDTQNTINWLFNHWFSDGQRQLLAQRSSEENIEKLVKFLGFIHDIGKATPVFQVKRSFDGDSELDIEILEKLFEGGFTGLDELILAAPQESQHARAGEAILDREGVPESITAIVGAHHGKPEEGPQDKQIATYTANYLQRDVGKNSADKKIQENWKQVQKTLFKYGLNLSGYESVDEIPDVNQPEAVLLEGLLIMADWLASSEYLGNDTAVPLFPLISLDQSFEELDMKKRFRNAMMVWYQTGEWVPDQIDTKDDLYKKYWGFNARPVQQIMTKAIAATKDPGVVIIEAPMGLGKTEIALLAAEQLAFKTGQNGLFMGLPTQATTNAMFARVEDWLEVLAKMQDENFSIKLMHGKAEFNEDYRQIPNASNVDDEGAVVINSWFSGKKSILTKFTVGTIDNLLLMGLKQKHLFLKHLGFSDKVVIIDEVHAYDSYMNQYLYKAIEWLGAYHVPLVILSATLPKLKRNALLKAYYKGKYGKHFKKNVIAPIGWQNQQAYPLLSILDDKEIKQITDFNGQSDQKSVELQVKRLQVTDAEVIQTVLQRICNGGIAGIIVNTVKHAQVLAKLVPDDVKLMVLHSAFLATDRVFLEKKLEKTIGKNADRPHKMIVIGTQILEQSLDIDFDVMFTDIAPMDLLLQRAGRLHRHCIKRPKTLERPRLYVMGINEFGDYGSANESIYEKYLLMKTDHFLSDKIQLPNDISSLVQNVYDNNTDKEVDQLIEARDKFNTDLQREEKKAEVFQIDAPNLAVSATDDDMTIHGWLSRGQNHVDTDERKAAAAVRDIQETIEVILVQHLGTGDFLMDGQNLKDCSPIKIAQQVVQIPGAIVPSYKINQVISQLETQTSHYFSDWQDSRWLRGALALPLDKNYLGELAGWKLHYSPILGLSYEKEDDDE